MAKGNVWTVPCKEGWKNVRENAQKASGVYATKAEAKEAGREIAKNNGCEHIIQNLNGQIAEKNSYGNDPCPPKDKN